jgi:hypothetical protein
MTQDCCVKLHEQGERIISVVADEDDADGA